MDRPALAGTHRPITDAHSVSSAPGAGFGCIWSPAELNTVLPTLGVSALAADDNRDVANRYVGDHTLHDCYGRRRVGVTSSRIV